MKAKPRRIELAEFGIPGLECEGEWVEVLPRTALLATVDEQFTEYQRTINRLQRQMLKETGEDEAAGIRAELEEASERFVDFVLEQQVVSWNLSDAEGSAVPLPGQGREWRELLPTGVQLKLFEFLSDLMWGDEEVQSHGKGEVQEESRAKKGGRKKR